MNDNKRHPIDVAVGNNLRLLRTQQGLSQEKLGDAVSLTFQQIQKYEKGTNRISASKMFEMAKVLNVSLLAFYEGTGLENNKTLLLNITPEALDLARQFDKIDNAALKKQVRGLVKVLGQQS